MPRPGSGVGRGRAAYLKGREGVMSIPCIVRHSIYSVYTIAIKARKRTTPSPPLPNAPRRSRAMPPGAVPSCPCRAARSRAVVPCRAERRRSAPSAGHPAEQAAGDVEGLAVYVVGPRGAEEEHAPGGLLG